MNETDEYQRCGRPTKNGDPCRAQLWGPQIACKIHMTEEDRVGDKYFQEGWRRAIAYNQTFAKRMVQDQIERLERQARGCKEPSTSTVTKLGSTWEYEYSYILRRADLQLTIPSCTYSDSRRPRNYMTGFVNPKLGRGRTRER